MVCHGEVMWAFRIRFERLRVGEYMEKERRKCSAERINNGQILWYTRRCPTTGYIASTFKWAKFVNPWNLSMSSNEFRDVNRKPLSNEELLEEIERYRPFGTTGSPD